MIINDKTSDDDDEQLGGDMKISRRVARNQLAIVANFAPDVSAVEGVVMMMIGMSNCQIVNDNFENHVDYVEDDYDADDNNVNEFVGTMLLTNI